MGEAEKIVDGASTFKLPYFYA